MGNKKRHTLIFLTLIIILVGFLRGYLFGNINWIFLTLTNGRMNSARTEFHFFLEWTPQQIVMLKWILTGLFSLIFFSLTYLFIKLSFGNKYYSKITLYLYLTFTSTALLLFVTGHLINMSNELYGIIHTLMNIVQSFMPLMILYILFRFLPQELEDK